MITFTKEQLIASAHARIEFAEMMLAGELEPLKERTWSIELELARIALASLEAEPLCYLTWHQGFRAPDDCEEYVVEAKPGDKSCDGTPAFPVYTAPPAPVSVPAAMEMDDDFDSAFEHGKAVGWNAYRAAMLQGADGTLTNEGTIPVTQFKPVADLYGLTSPTGGETSFTFDAVEARDFIDGGWLCQEYVTLERYQETLFQGAEPVTTAYKLPFEQWLSQQTGTIDVECGCVMTEVFFHWLRVAYEAGNSPATPDGWVACSERMPEIGIKVLCFPVNDEPIHATYNGQVWLQDISWSTSDEPIDNVISCNVFHWMPLPAAPQ
ncbi:DUF551 domain-containing protein [Citrobacter freundii]|uniref:DUF551 domain-containing protein n=1 Tax=Citrobacter freundii TaxID=546 RepID=UPI00397E45D0